MRIKGAVFWIVLWVGLVREHASELINGRFPYYLMEELRVGLGIGNVASDTNFSPTWPDVQRTDVMFSLKYADLRLETMNFFIINPNTSVLKIARLIDREQVCKQHAGPCYVPIDVIAQASPDFSQTIQIIVEIMDANDNAPNFDNSSVALLLPRQIYAGTLFQLPEARDADSGKLSVQNYAIEPPNLVFSCSVSYDNSTHVATGVHLKALVNFNLTSPLQLTLKAFDGGNPAKNAETKINIIPNISPDLKTDVSSGAVAPGQKIGIFVPEETEPGEKIGQVSHLNDEPITFEISIEAHVPEGHSKFFIDSASGELYLTSELDYESQSEYNVTVTLTQVGGLNTRTVQITVFVTDVNEFAPTITVNTATGSSAIYVHHNTSINSTLAEIKTHDKDGGVFSKSTCAITPDAFQPYLGLVEKHNNTFALTVLEEGFSDNSIFQKRNYIHVTCRDYGLPTLSSHVTLSLFLVADDISSPIFSQDSYSTSVFENLPAGSSVLQVKAYDTELNDNGVIYKLDKSMEEVLSVDEMSGELSTKMALDREATPAYSFDVYAYDSDDMSKFSSVKVVVTLVDTDDNPPIFQDNPYAFGVYENEAAGHIVGSVTASDADAYPNNVVAYKISPDPATPTTQIPFTVDKYDGTIKTTALLDREATPVYYFLISTENPLKNSTHTSTASITIYVADRNDHKPEVIWPSGGDDTITLSRNTPEGYVAARVKAVDYDVGDNGNMEFRIVGCDPPNIFEIHKFNGKILTRRQLATVTEDRVKLKIEITDRGRVALRTRTTLYVLLTNNTGITDLGEDASLISNVTYVNYNATIISSLSIAAFLLLVTIVLVIVFVYQVMHGRHRKHARTPRVCQHPLLSTSSGRRSRNLLLEAEES